MTVCQQQTYSTGRPYAAENRCMYGYLHHVWSHTDWDICASVGSVPESSTTHKTSLKYFNPSLTK